MKIQSQPQSTSNGREPHAPSYFDLQATWGVTKHFGGSQSTDALAALCHIDRGAYVLDVGCGSGMTPCYLAQTIGCRVVGVDISQRMIAWSRRRAHRACLDDRVIFSVADAQHLPFADRTFDVVICESVTAFVADKPRAVAEYTRVIRPGGYVGLNEGAWLTPPPADLAAYLARVMAGADFLAPDAWRNLLAGAGLTDLVVQRSTNSARQQWKGELRRLDRDDLRERLRAWKTFGSLLVTSAAFRRYLRELWPSRSVFHMSDYLGYGVFVGRKSATGSQARTEEHDAATDSGAA